MEKLKILIIEDDPEYHLGLLKNISDRLNLQFPLKRIKTKEDAIESLSLSFVENQSWSKRDKSILEVEMEECDFGQASKTNQIGQFFSEYQIRKRRNKINYYLSDIRQASQFSNNLFGNSHRDYVSQDNSTKNLCCDEGIIDHSYCIKISNLQYSEENNFNFLWIRDIWESRKVLEIDYPDKFFYSSPVKYIAVIDLVWDELFADEDLMSFLIKKARKRNRDIRRLYFEMFHNDIFNYEFRTDIVDWYEYIDNKTTRKKIFKLDTNYKSNLNHLAGDSPKYIKNGFVSKINRQARAA